MVEVSNFKTNRWTSIVILMLVCILALVIAACVTNWYRVVEPLDSTQAGLKTYYYFSPRKISSQTKANGNVAETVFDYDWGDFKLTRVHQIINASVAMGAISWLVYLFTTILAILVQIELVKQIGSLSAWLLVKILIIVATVILLMSICILGGITPAFRKDQQPDDPNNFNPCKDTCEFHWAGSTNGVKYGPTTGWIIAIITFFLSVAASVLPWFKQDTGFGTPNPEK